MLDKPVITGFWLIFTDFYIIFEKLLQAESMLRLIWILQEVKHNIWWVKIHKINALLSDLMEIVRKNLIIDLHHVLLLVIVTMDRATVDQIQWYVLELF